MDNNEIQKSVNDAVVLEILKLTLTSDITMTCHGETMTYHFDEKPNEGEGFELYVDDKKTVYGLSCGSLLEVIGILIQDYASGIITDVQVQERAVEMVHEPVAENETEMELE